MANTHSSRTKRNTVSISDGKHTWDKQTRQRRRKLRGSRFLNTGFFGVKQNKKMSPLLANKQSKRYWVKWESDGKQSGAKAGGSQ